jgi:hypothetical protein
VVTNTGSDISKCIGYPPIPPLPLNNIQVIKRIS